LVGGGVQLEAVISAGRSTTGSREEGMALGIDVKSNRGKSAKDPNRAVAQVLGELLVSCLLCRSGFSAHDFALLGTWIVQSEKDDALVRFFEAIKDHQWAKLREFQRWLGSADNVEAYAIRCSGRLSVAVVKTHFDLLQGTRLLYSEALSVEESANLLRVFADLQWHPF
jgi:hypothetical protein